MPQLSRHLRGNQNATDRWKKYSFLPFLVLTSQLLLTPVWAVDLTGTPVSAINDSACVGTHAGTNLGCNAKEFTVNPVFSAAPDTPPMCVAGNNFDFLVDLQLSGSNANRYDITFYTGQTNNPPDVNDSSKFCSAAAFPHSLPTPWDNLDGNLNACSDYTSAGDSIVRIDEIKVQCESDAAGYLTVPYTLAYDVNTGTPACNPADPSTYPIPLKSKCQSGASSVSGTIKVFSGAYVDVTKQTLPGGDSQSFTFSAAGPTVPYLLPDPNPNGTMGGSFVIALTGSTTLDLPIPTDGTYTPTSAAAATNTLSNINFSDGQTTRFYINALSATQRLTINESETTNWETTALISCSDVSGKGSPNTILTPASRRIEVDLSSAASAKKCTITNTKRSRITLRKSINGRYASGDEFTVSASNGGTLTGVTSVTTISPATTASTIFYSTPDTSLTITDTVAGTANLTNYLSHLTCTNAEDGKSWATPNTSLPNDQLATSYSFTPKPGDDITCTFTNSRKVGLTLQKTWVDAIVSNAVDVTATGLTALNSVADSANETDTAAIQYVRIGDAITLGETFTVGSAINYSSTLSCSGNATALSGNVLTVNSADTAIICTYSNLQNANLTVLKTADKGTVKPGDIITYTLLFTNTGGGPATNISVSDVLSPYIAFGTDSYPSASAPLAPAFEFSGSGTYPTPDSPKYFNSSNTEFTPTGTYDGTVAKWTIPFSVGTLGGGNSFTLKYKTQVK